MSNQLLRRYLLCLLILSTLYISTSAQHTLDKVAEYGKGGFNFMVITDQGGNGYYDQKLIAPYMAELADKGNANFVLTLGDNFHNLGVESIHDPLWWTNFELVYDHPALQIPWYPTLGNHEHQGQIQPHIDYSKVSRRWEMPDRYYSKHFVTNEGVTLDIFIIDTTPLIESYRNNLAKYPGVEGLEREDQLQWLEQVLSHSDADFKIVAGHHPIYAYPSPTSSPRLEMQNYVDSILRKYGVDLYLSGHVHSHQHIQPQGSNIDYVVVTSAARAYKPESIEGTRFCSGKSGFAYISIKGKALTLFLLDKEGNELYHFQRQKK